MYDELVERLRAGTYTLEELSIILPKAADAIEKLSAQNKKWEQVVKTLLDFLPVWTPVTERPPEDEEAVLVYEADHNNHFLAIYEDGRWKSFDPTYKETYFDETIYWHITAWMPLPEPYKEGEKDDDKC